MGINFAKERAEKNNNTHLQPDLKRKKKDTMFTMLFKTDHNWLWVSLNGSEEGPHRALLVLISALAKFMLNFVSVATLKRKMFGPV